MPGPPFPSGGDTPYDYTPNTPPYINSNIHPNASAGGLNGLGAACAGGGDPTIPIPIDPALAGLVAIDPALQQLDGAVLQGVPEPKVRAVDLFCT